MDKTIYEEIKDDNKLVTVKKIDAEGVISWIPIDLANADYQAYLKYLDESKQL